MIKILTLAIIGLLSMNSAVAMENEPTGFRGIDWGSSATSVQGLMEVNDQALLQRAVGSQYGLSVGLPYKSYERQGDKRAFDGTPVLKTIYTFYRDQFLAATIVYISSMGDPPEINQHFPNDGNEARINKSLTKYFGIYDASKLSLFDRLKPSNRGLPIYSGETTQINNKCGAVGIHATHPPPWLYNCELQFRATVLYRQGLEDFKKSMEESRANLENSISKEKAREKAKPDF